MKVPTFLQPLWEATLNVFSSIKWQRTRALFNNGLYYGLIEHDHDRLRELLSTDYYIILTRRKCHLTSYLITLVSWIVQHKGAHYSHALMNVEGDIPGHVGFKLIEATGTGVHYSTFMEVFDCDSVALMAPLGVSPTEWTDVLDQVKSEIGKPYDDYFDLLTDQAVSCVEMVYQGLKKLPNYETRFASLLKLIEEHGNNLTPQMMYDCGDMAIVYEVRR